MEPLSPEPIALIRLQFALEGIGLDADDRLVRLPGAAAEEIPRVYVARHANGYARFFRQDLRDDIVAWLAGLPPEVALDQPDRVVQILALDGPAVGRWAGTSYVVPRPPEPATFPDVVVLTEPDCPLIHRFDPELLQHRPVFAIVVEGEIRSACVSARENAAAAEAWVQTAPGFRRCGYATQTTAAWGHGVVTRGKAAFYSHLWTNRASQGVAVRLGLTPFIDAVGYL